jgi:hypothetical protein
MTLPSLRLLVAGLLPRRTGCNSRPLYVLFVLGKLLLVPINSLCSSASPSPVCHWTMLLANLHLHVAINRRTKGWNLGTCKKRGLFGNRDCFPEKRFHLIFKASIRKTDNFTRTQDLVGPVWGLLVPTGAQISVFSRHLRRYETSFIHTPYRHGQNVKTRAGVRAAVAWLFQI